jgi:HEPN domain-containing protein
MPPKRRPADDPVEWLNRARSNLARAKADIRVPGVYLEDLCFDAQQAAEKAIKAVLLKLGVPFPFIHDLGGLLDLIRKAGGTVPRSVRDAGRLTRFAVVTRYPGIAEPVSHEDYKRSIRIAEGILRWAEKLVARTMTGSRRKR